MTLREKIDADFKEAFKARDEARTSVLRLLLASIKNKELEKRTKLSKSEKIEDLEKLSRISDDEIIGVTAAEIKKRKEAAEQYLQGGRQELAQKETAEAKIISVYLPQQLEEEEIRKLVLDAIGKTGASAVGDLGKVMSILMPQVKGKADGGQVTMIVKEELAKKNQN
ncbi:MAG: GatB/YqeY domain-containing protein [Candidatus Portnoybacteria bacterium]|nr:GatB/YqeY domain-containing protein [Candidatus Portnoybacteria bacterium]